MTSDEGLKVQVLTVGPLMMNAFLVTAPAATPEASGEAILIDPGAEPERLLAAVDASGCRLTHLLATHGHFDHIGAAAAFQALAATTPTELPLLCHADDVVLIEEMPAIQRAYGFPTTALPAYDASLTSGTEIPLGLGSLLVQHVPGHSPGQVMFVSKGRAFVGDCLFAGSVGRTDLPGGDFVQLERSIREHIYALPDATIIHSGHGPDTTVGREKATNPFVNER
jgi:hydroxyacylglutathione hydrolase